MLNGKHLVVVMPAYNAAQTLKQTWDEIPHDYVDDVILVDDCSVDTTVEVAENLGITTIIQAANRGYGANQKRCYKEALRLGADVIIMLHPDYQYSPRLILTMATLVLSGHYDVALGSRILGGHSLSNGMPFYKYFSNRVLTLIQNLSLGAKLSEYHTGYRAFSREVLETLPLEENSDDFVFDNEMLLQCLFFNFQIGEISCPTRYFPTSSNINFRRSVKYGFGVLITTSRYLVSKYLNVNVAIFNQNGRRLNRD